MSYSFFRTVPQYDLGPARIGNDFYFSHWVIPEIERRSKFGHCNCYDIIAAQKQSEFWPLYETKHYCLYYGLYDPLLNITPLIMDPVAIEDWTKDYYDYYVIIT